MGKQNLEISTSKQGVYQPQPNYHHSWLKSILDAIEPMIQVYLMGGTGNEFSDTTVWNEPKKRQLLT